jgi:hypothetical protein
VHDLQTDRVHQLGGAAAAHQRPCIRPESSAASLFQRLESAMPWVMHLMVVLAGVAIASLAVLLVGLLSEMLIWPARLEQARSRIG